jgi:hypothetical protein
MHNGHAQPDELEVSDLDHFRINFKGEIQGVQPGVMSIGSSRRLNGIGRIDRLGQDPPVTATPLTEERLRQILDEKKHLDQVVTTFEGVGAASGLALAVTGFALKKWSEIIGSILLSIGTSIASASVYSNISRRF